MEWSDQRADHSSHQQRDVVLSVLQDKDEGSVHDDLLLPGEGGAEEDQLYPCGCGPLCPLLGDLNNRVVEDAADAYQRKIVNLLLLVSWNNVYPEAGH